MSDFGGITLFIFLFVLLAFIGILPIAGKWKVYGKLGMLGWYSIIPVYADYKLCERVHRTDEGKTFTMAYLIVLICSWAFCWVDTVGVLLALAQLVMTIIVLNDLSRAFGKETGYTIGLVIFGFVFWTMLGFGASEPVDLDNEGE
ncbi:DUF5684 domain-containing protein [Collinsella aerofaciens]|uniref:DUF5684 domain-containing protein n=1 Tax=Collinsella aerofaciens TaxID=74426 RepID=UPI003D7ACCFA